MQVLVIVTNVDMLIETCTTAVPRLRDVQEAALQCHSRDGSQGGRPKAAAQLGVRVMAELL